MTWLGFETQDSFALGACLNHQAIETVTNREQREEIEDLMPLHTTSMTSKTGQSFHQVYGEWARGRGVCEQVRRTEMAETKKLHSGAGIAQLVVLGLAAKVSRVRYSSGDIFR